MTQQAGQRVIFSYPGATPPASLLDQISAGEVGGVIFFGENTTNLSQIAGVVAQVKAAHDASPVRSPLLLRSARDVSQGQTTVAALADAVQRHDLKPGHFKIALRRV